MTRHWTLCSLISRSERQHRPTNTYSDENRTSFSDPAYQQQSFSYDQDFSGSYDIAPPGQGEILSGPDFLPETLSSIYLITMGEAQIADPPLADSNLLTHVGMTDVITAPGMQHWDAQSWSM